MLNTLPEVITVFFFAGLGALYLFRDLYALGKGLIGSRIFRGKLKNSWPRAQTETRQARRATARGFAAASARLAAMEHRKSNTQTSLLSRIFRRITTALQRGPKTQKIDFPNPKA
jgi:hypothetical protein